MDDYDMLKISFCTCIKFRWIWNVIILYFLKLIFLSTIVLQSGHLKQAPKTFFSPLHLKLFAWRHLKKRTKRKKNTICVSLWKFRFLEDQGWHSIDPPTFKLSEYDMFCNIDVKAHQSWQFKNVTCLLYLTFRWAHEFPPAVSPSCTVLGRLKKYSNDFSLCFNTTVYIMMALTLSF